MMHGSLVAQVVATVCAQTQTPAPGNQPPAAGQAMLFAVMLAVIAFMLLSARSQKKREKKERDDLFNRLSKNDRVLTVGGIIGTIAAVKDNEVIVKVDESNNTKMTFLKSAGQRILSNEVETAEKK